MSYLKAILKKVLSLMLIPYDKALHVISGFAIFIFSSLAIHFIAFILLYFNITTAIYIIDFTPLIIVVLSAIGKETYDYKTYGKFDLADMTMTIIPALIMVAYLAVI